MNDQGSEVRCLIRAIRPIRGGAYWLVSLPAPGNSSRWQSGLKTVKALSKRIQSENKAKTKSVSVKHTLFSRPISPMHDFFKIAIVCEPSLQPGRDIVAACEPRCRRGAIGASFAAPRSLCVLRVLRVYPPGGRPFPKRAKELPTVPKHSPTSPNGSQAVPKRFPNVPKPALNAFCLKRMPFSRGLPVWREKYFFRCGFAHRPKLTNPRRWPTMRTNQWPEDVILVRSYSASTPTVQSPYSGPAAVLLGPWIANPQENRRNLRIRKSKKNFCRKQTLVAVSVGVPALAGECHLKAELQPRPKAATVRDITLPNRFRTEKESNMFTLHACVRTIPNVSLGNPLVFLLRHLLQQFQQHAGRSRCLRPGPRS